MEFRRTVSLLSLVLLVAHPCLAGDIEGRVTLRSTGPNSKSAISPFARMHPSEGAMGISSSEAISVVYLAGDPSLPPGDSTARRPVMDQRDLTLIPHVLPVVVGTTVDFPNSDALYHNLFSLSPVRKFDLGRYPKGVVKQVTFDKEGEVHVFCDIHPSMSAVVLVLPNRFYAKVSSDGTFTIRDVPAGEFTVHAWHEQLPDVSQRVIVPEKGLAHVEFELGE